MENNHQSVNIEYLIRNAVPKKITEIMGLNRKFNTCSLSLHKAGPMALHLIKDFNTTLSAPLIITLSGKKEKIDIPIGFIPFPSPYGSIIINGAEKAPVLRLQNIPGVYFHSLEKSREIHLISSYKSRYIRLKYTPDASPYCEIGLYSSGSRDSIRVNLSHPEAPRTLKAEESNIRQKLEEQDAWDTLWKKINSFGVNLETRQSWNRVLSRNSKSEVLEIEDIIRAIYIIGNKESFESISLENSIHNLKGQKVKLLSDNISFQVCRPFKHLWSKTPEEILQELTGYFNKDPKLRNQFSSLSDGRLFPPLNRLNPLAILSDCRKIKRGSIGKDRTGIPKADRDVDESHKMKICPIETPESEEVGLTLFLAKNATVNPSTQQIIHGNSILGYSASLIPFIGHNEGARATFGAKNITVPAT